MVVTCDIQFEDNPDAIFYAGQVINGKVTLTADKVKQVKGVVLKITGSAHTRWSKSNGNNKSSTTYYADVDYINTVTDLMKPSSSDQSVVIAPGIHTFSFVCHIPLNCPSSFESFYGHIRYIIKINLVRPWKFDQTFTKAFTVLSLRNLNFDSHILKGIYYAGQVVNGKVTITADKQKVVKAVALKIIGMAHTEWSEEDTDSSSGRKTETTYYGHVDYIKSKIFLSETFKPNSDNDRLIIEAGTHSFQFSCFLPPMCPSSVETVNGCIRYWIQITLKRPWKSDLKYKKGFTVINIKNFNIEGNREWQLPVQNDIAKVFCCGPCESDPLQIQVQLPQTGFVPGQLIPISILINNNIATDINEMCARLVMIIDCFSTHPRSEHKQETRVVSILKGDPVQRFSNKQFNYLLPIPATPPSCNTLCSIIHIGYRVEVAAKIDGIMYSNQCVHVPITIGNIPFQMDGVVIQQQPLPSSYNKESNRTVLNLLENNNNNTASTSNGNIEPWCQMGNTAPPVYMEATHMPKGQLSKDAENDYGEKIFTPKYPVFNLPSPTNQQANCAHLGGDEIDGHVVPPAVTDPDKTTWL